MLLRNLANFIESLLRQILGDDALGRCSRRPNQHNVAGHFPVNPGADFDYGLSMNAVK